jgi:hypothetical protein
VSLPITTSASTIATSPVSPESLNDMFTDSAAAGINRPATLESYDADEFRFARLGIGVSSLELEPDISL